MPNDMIDFIGFIQTIAYIPIQVSITKQVAEEIAKYLYIYYYI